jgi:hypothetical protein
MKNPLPIAIQSKTFTRRQTFGFFALGVISTATTSALATSGNDHKLSQRVDSALSVITGSDHNPKPIVISF